MSNQATSPDTANITFSQASAAGLTHSAWLIGPTTDPSGRDRVLASHSVSPGSAQEQTTRDTFGPLFGGSSPSADLQRSLASRLRAAMGVNGSPEYVLTWKSWAIGLGEPICALRASARRISGSDSGGWATPRCQNTRTTSQRYNEQGEIDTHTNLEEQAITAGWPTATSRDHKDGDAQSCQNVEDNALLGRMVHTAGTHAGMECPDGYRLNQSFSLWLMGYPGEWACCGARAMQSYRKSQRSSSKQ